MSDYTYQCGIHGGYPAHSHHCPGCMAAARSIARDLHLYAVAKQDSRLIEKISRLYVMLTGGFCLDDRIAAVCHCGGVILNGFDHRCPDGLETERDPNLTPPSSTAP